MFASHIVKVSPNTVMHLKNAGAFYDHIFHKTVPAE